MSIIDAYNKAMAQRKLDRERDKAMHKEKRRKFQLENVQLHNALQDLSYTAQRRAGVEKPKVRYITRSQAFD